METLFSGIKTADGLPVLSPEAIQAMRRENSDLTLIAQPGGQENALRSMADITITGGNRGGGKSYTLLMEALKDADKTDFSGLILRNERDDLTNIIKQSYRIFSNYGTYLSSKDLMTWDFTAGGDLVLSYHAGDYRKFEIRFQGREFNFIGVDEITHMAYKKFQYIKTTLRTGSKIRTRIICTCNPDPDSWVATFIDWWIGEDGFPIKERDGKIRYCYMGGEDVTDVVWGDSKEEVYEKCRHRLDWVMKPGEDYRDYILSVTFIRAELDDNKKLPKGYKAMLAGQSDEAVARDLLGNWKFKAMSDDIIKWQHMEDFFNNAARTGDGVRRASCDVAFDGGDNLVMWLRVGNHFQDVYVCRCDSKRTVEIVRAKLAEWGVREENFTYDLNGVGQTFKGFFPKARPFNNIGAVDEKLKYIYDKLKDQAAYTLAQKLVNGELSINPAILDRKFDGHGFKGMSLRDILMKERRAIRQDEKYEKAWKLITKLVMRQLVGHSPDFFEAMIYSELFFIEKKKKHYRPNGLGRFISPINYRR